MRLRVIDYIANPGGGVRFVSAIVAALRDADIELVSHGAALGRYRESLTGRAEIRFVDRREPFQTFFAGLRRQRGGGRLLGALSDPDFHFRVPSFLLAGTDVVWFPWVHRHRLLLERHQRDARRVVGSFHDAIMVDRHDVVPESTRRNELATCLTWFSSPATIVASSQTTVRTIRRLGLAEPTRPVEVIPVGMDHLIGCRVEDVKVALPTEPYVYYPANTAAHKNHATLIEACARVSPRIQLVLTGMGTDLRRSGPRSSLASQIARVGLTAGKNVLGFGYVSDAEVTALLKNATALVMPSLAEGGGSFPVLEAMTMGVPVLCADIPVMREQLGRTGGSVTWFDPMSPDDLASKLNGLRINGALWRARAIEDSQELRIRSWHQVAQEYRAVFERIARE